MHLPKLRDILEGIPASDIQNKTVKSLIKNKIHCLDKVNRDHKDIVFKIVQFSVVYFKYWRKVVMSNGTNRYYEVTIDTTKELALIGMELDLGKKYFEGLNNNLYNADGAFLSLSTNPKYIKKTKPRLSKSGLTNISIEELSKDTAFRSRAANSSLFYHLGDKMCDIVEMYRNGSTGYWTPAATLVPGHNQACSIFRIGFSATGPDFQGAGYPNAFP